MESTSDERSDEPFIFISYRHSDAPEAALQIVRELKDQLGHDRVFMDKTHMMTGMDFRTQSVVEVARAHSVVVVIGKEWLNASFETGAKAGTRRLDDFDDVVRREISTALEHELFVYPVLVNSASRPTEDELPKELAPLIYRVESIPNDDGSFAMLVDNIVANMKWHTLKSAFPDPPPHIVTISLTEAFGADAGSFRQSVYQQFRPFCDAVFQEMDARYPAQVDFPEYGYGRDWWLERDGQRIRHAREIMDLGWGAFVEDTRPVVQVGARPGSTLEFVLGSHMPLPDDSKQLVPFIIQTPDLGTNVERAANALHQADALLITAGAGMGVDSGLPDFRGDEGFWKSYPPLGKLQISFEEAANPKWFFDDPTLAWGFYGHRLNLYRATRPHDGFYIVRNWMKRKLGGFVFTSNVDGQFQRAGVQWEWIVECHGSINYLQCLERCTDDILSAEDFDVSVDPKTFRATGKLPTCPNCGCLLRPNILMFDDDSWNPNRTNMQMQRYEEWLEKILGSDLAVVECGAGTAVPTIRKESEKRSGRLIRINPRDGDVPAPHLSIKRGAKEALMEINDKLTSIGNQTR